MNREMPTIGAYAYASNTVDAQAWSRADQTALNQAIDARRLNILGHAQQSAPKIVAPSQENAVSAARIVKVYVADPNANLPLDKRVLFKGEEKLTDLTDQELFYEINIADILTKHNELRVKTIDKDQAAKFGRDIFLEPAKIRDLKMVVTTVATF